MSWIDLMRTGQTIAQQQQTPQAPAPAPTYDPPTDQTPDAQAPSFDMPPPDFSRPPDQAPQAPANSFPSGGGFSGVMGGQATAAAQPQASSGGSGNYDDFGRMWIASGGRTVSDLAAFIKAHPEFGASTFGTKGDKVMIGGRAYDAVLASGEGGGRGAQWNYLDPNNPGTSAGPQAGATSGQIFTDPATAQWEQMIRSLTDRLNTPQQNPDFGPLTDYLRKYFGELQQPAYTPAQSELIQNQTLDPLTRERDAAQQRLTQDLARRGITPGSGPAIQASQDINKNFEQLRTQTQADFSRQALDRTDQRSAQAAQVGGTLAALQNGQFGQDEQRALQAVAMLGQIPQYADSRLRLAQSSLIPSNPASLASLYPQYAQLGMQQGQYDQNSNNQFTNMLMQLILQAL